MAAVIGTLKPKDGSQPRLCGNSCRIPESGYRWCSKADSWSLTVVGSFASRGDLGSALMDFPWPMGGAMQGLCPHQAHRSHGFMEPEDADHSLEVVGQNMQAHLGSYIDKPSSQEVR